MTKESDISTYTTDASFSWNGYNYQGKVGLFIALKKIEELDKSLEDLNEYFLELEWLEDFSIKKNDEYLTIHQVKTYQSSGISNYREAIWTLLAKVLEVDSIKVAYLHTTSNLEIPKEFLKEQKIVKPSKAVTKPRIKSPYECCKAVMDSEESNKVFKKFELYNYGTKVNKLQYCSFDDIEKK